ncbi:MAG: hypothetical protein Q8N25_02510 [Methylotenera sp.]|nr:hypothetical protein [Methylotenera sp.]MDP2152371.1 hypothetical protein [Methylotenera sp.]MDP3059620.1 hypothetical protein [Methylotenera sp.]
MSNNNEVLQTLLNLNLGPIAEEILSKISLDNINGISSSELKSEHKMYLCLMHTIAPVLDSQDIIIEIQMVNINKKADTCNVDYRILTLASIAECADKNQMMLDMLFLPFIKLYALQNMKHFKKANQELTDMRAAGETNIHVFLAKRNKKSSKKAGHAYV